MQHLRPGLQFDADPPQHASLHSFYSEVRVHPARKLAAAHAQRLDAEVLAKALGLSGYEEGRERLNVRAEQIEDEDSWLSLLEKALGATENNELRYTIDEHLCVRTWRTEELAARARDALEGILAKLDAPLPVENEFVDVPSPADLRKKIGRPFELQKGLAEDEFWMGSPEDEPERADNETRHPVCMPHRFELGRTPVTLAQYQCFAKGHLMQEEEFVSGVSWFDAKIYLRYRRVKDKKPYRLPTEAEMEWAMRGGSATSYWWGNDADKRSALKRGSLRGEARAHPFGMVGFGGTALCQWVEDAYQDYPEQDRDGHSARSVSGEASFFRVSRGGALGGEDKESRSAYREMTFASNAFGFLGLRLALSAPSPEPADYQ